MKTSFEPGWANSNAAEKDYLDIMVDIAREQVASDVEAAIVEHLSGRIVRLHFREGAAA